MVRPFCVIHLNDLVLVIETKNILINVYTKLVNRNVHIEYCSHCITSHRKLQKILGKWTKYLIMQLMTHIERMFVIGKIEIVRWPNVALMRDARTMTDWCSSDSHSNVSASIFQHTSNGRAKQMESMIA